MINLPPRLAVVARYVLDGEPFADIGTDHGYLPAHLVATGRVPRAIAGDVLPGPLEAARATVEAEGLADRILLRLGSGLTVVAPGEAASAAICGMGGPLMVRLLAEGPLEGIRRLILQPNTDEDLVRAWLAANGWRLVAEAIAPDGRKLYPVLVAERGPMRLTRMEEVVGPLLLRQGGPLVHQYVERQLALAREALAGAGRSDRPAARERAAGLAEHARLLEAALEQLGGGSGT